MKVDLPDVMLLIGAFLIVIGIAQIYVPAAWIVSGLFVIVFAYLVAKERNNASSTKSDQQQ